MPAVPKRREKGLRRDKKARAPSKLPICGLYAAAKCAGIHLKTAADVEDFRKTCCANGLLDPCNGNWVGGSREIEQAHICEHFGCAVSNSHHNLDHRRGSMCIMVLLIASKVHHNCVLHGRMLLMLLPAEGHTWPEMRFHS